jgi:TRAP-type C4-dicarboxylate transport system permease small subunit
MVRVYLKQAAIIWATFGGFVLLLIVAVTTSNVGAFAIDRAVRHFDSTFLALPGFEDFVRLAISSAALMFFPYCQSMRGHVSVDILISRTNLKVQWALDVFSLILTVILALFLAYWMGFGLLETKADNAVSQVLGWHEWPFYIPGILSLLLWALIAFMQIFEPKSNSDD